MRPMNPLPPLVEEKLEDVRRLCEQYGVRKLTIFGSAVDGTFDPERSDLDFVVDIPNDGDSMERGHRYRRFWDALEELFSRRVDLVTLEGVRNPFLRHSIVTTQRPLYEAA